MDLKKNIFAFCLIFGLDLVLSVPTFGNEHVHIKVHIPHEIHTKSYVKPKHTVVHHAPKHHVTHKIIHHYHRRPDHKIKEKEPELENHYLSELDNTHSNDHVYEHNHGPKHIEETFLVKEQHHQHHHDHKATKEQHYQQHHDHKPIEPVKVFNVIKDYEPTYEPHADYGKSHVQAIKLIQSPQLHSHFKPNHFPQSHDHHEETVKFIEEKPKHFHYQNHAPHEEVFKVIHTHPHSEHDHVQDHNHFRHEPQVKEVVDEEPDYDDHFESHKYEANNDDLETHLLPEIIDESLELFKNKLTKNHNHEDNYQHNYGYHAKERHHAPEANYLTSPEPETALEEHVEYEEPPTSNHHYFQQPTQTHDYITPVVAAISKPHRHYGLPVPAEIAKPHQHYGPPSILSGHEENAYASNHNYLTDYEKFLPSPEAPPDFNISHDHQQENTLDETYSGHDSYTAGHVQGLDNSVGYS